MVDAPVTAVPLGTTPSRRMTAELSRRTATLTAA